MTKRRRLSELMFGRSHGFKTGAKTPINVVASGTGTIAAGGIFTVVAGATCTQAYLTVVSGTNIGTLVGTDQGMKAPI